MRGVVSSLLRQQSHSTRRSFVVASAQQQQRVGNPMVDRGGSSAAPLVPPRPAMANVVVVNSVCCGQQRAELSTLRRGVTGPLSARVRLPMRGLEEFRDPEIIKVGLGWTSCFKTLGLWGRATHLLEHHIDESTESWLGFSVAFAFLVSTSNTTVVYIQEAITLYFICCLACDLGHDVYAQRSALVCTIMIAWQ